MRVGIAQHLLLSVSHLFLNIIISLVLLWETRPLKLVGLLKEVGPKERECLLHGLGRELDLAMHLLLSILHLLLIITLSLLFYKGNCPWRVLKSNGKVGLWEWEGEDASGGWPSEGMDVHGSCGSHVGSRILEIRMVLSCCMAGSIWYGAGVVMKYIDRCR